MPGALQGAVRCGSVQRCVLRMIMPHLVRLVEVLVIAVLQYDGCCTEHSKHVVCGKGLILLAGADVKLQISAFRDHLLQEAVKIVEQRDPLVEVSLCRAASVEQGQKDKAIDVNDEPRPCLFVHPFKAVERLCNALKRRGCHMLDEDLDRRRL